MQAELVCPYFNRKVGTPSMSDFDLKKIYTSPDGNIYSFSGYGGVENCSDCDDFTQVNEYDRDDGLVCWFCKRCEDRLHL